MSWKKPASARRPAHGAALTPLADIQTWDGKAPRPQPRSPGFLPTTQRGRSPPRWNTRWEACRIQACGRCPRNLPPEACRRPKMRWKGTSGRLSPRHGAGRENGMERRAACEIPADRPAGATPTGQTGGTHLSRSHSDCGSPDPKSTSPSSLDIQIFRSHQLPLPCLRQPIFPHPLCR